MAAQTPIPPVPDQAEPASGARRFVAVLLWLLSAVVGVGGAWLVFGLAEYEGGSIVGALLVGVPFGLLLGAAVVATMQARDRRTSTPAVFGVSLVLALTLLGINGYLGQRSTEQTADDECSPEERAQFGALSFYDDLDQKPTGTQSGSCYVVYTIDQTCQQARDTLHQLLDDDGWQGEREDQFRYKDCVAMSIHWEGSHDLPGDALTESDDGSTTVALDTGSGP